MTITIPDPNHWSTKWHGVGRICPYIQMDELNGRIPGDRKLGKMFCLVRTILVHPIQKSRKTQPIIIMKFGDVHCFAINRSVIEN